MSNNPVNCWELSPRQSAAKPAPKGSEGSTTRVRSLSLDGMAVKPHERRTPHAGDDIVWAAWRHVEAVIKNAAITQPDQCIAKRLYMVNTDYLFLRPHVNRQFVPLVERQSINQDALVQPVERQRLH